ncbi:hypothetical protein RR46_03150 [Papilio xuthus]|uniref:Uncharacterized protein n=1 Tax=Papilio xuthus TaxID=66420 RepID=A0A194Q773_PAPXU|nr:hypothetical protein RR46_03150 [Papilio xuthus]
MALKEYCEMQNVDNTVPRHSPHGAPAVATSSPFNTSLHLQKSSCEHDAHTHRAVNSFRQRYNTLFT